MTELYNLGLYLHLFFIKFLIFLLVLHIVFVWMNARKFDYIKRLMLFLPFYYLIISFVFFTGVLVLAVNSFAINWTILLMLFAFLLLIALGAIGFKRLKMVRLSGDFVKFRTFMSIKIVFEILVLSIVSFLGVRF